MHAKYLIIGVNAAGFYALETLRKNDPNSSIVAINGEPYGPYKRTKVNKKFFPLNLNIDKYQLAGASWYKENKITLLNNSKVKSINTYSKNAVLDTGKVIKWDRLLISTGAESYCPSSSVFKQAVSIRTYSDALKVKELIANTKSCLVYGLGIQGMETAAQLYEAGLEVTLAGRGSRILKRYFSSHIADMIVNLFKERKISILYNTAVDRIKAYTSERNNGRVVCKNSVNIKGVDGLFDFLIYSMGIVPETSLVKSRNINFDKGILVNSRMETSVPYIYAAGDCTQIETGNITDHWHAAQDQGRTAAANMAGIYKKWPSKKYRVKIEIFGKYFFSMQPSIEKQADNLITEESVLTNGVYRLFYYEDNILKGLEMAGDKPRAKIYEAAVNEEWSREKVLTLLS